MPPDVAKCARCAAAATIAFAHATDWLDGPEGWVCVACQLDEARGVESPRLSTQRPSRPHGRIRRRTAVAILLALAFALAGLPELLGDRPYDVDGAVKTVVVD